MSLSFLGYDEKVVTFAVEGDLAAGDLVKISADETVKATTAGEVFCGKVINVRNGFAAVQLSGYMEADCNGEVELGFTKIAADESNTVAYAEDGHEVLVISATNNRIGFIL